MPALGTTKGEHTLTSTAELYKPGEVGPDVAFQFPSTPTFISESIMKNTKQVSKRQLGKDGPMVSAIGLGAMGRSCKVILVYMRLIFNQVSERGMDGLTRRKRWRR
jgi:hypothetical protein